MPYFLTLLIDGALAGAIYALIALAFVLIYKASAMMNFALGEWTMFGAMFTSAGLNLLHQGPLIALGIAGLAMIALATGFYRLVVRHLVARPALSAIMATLGLGMLMRGSGALFSGMPGLALRPMAIDPVEVGGLVIATDKLIAAAVAGLCVALVAVFYRFSRTGVALRAIADDQQAAASVGIDVDRHLLIVWGLAGMISVVAGIAWALVTGGGFGVALIGLKIIPIVILGGLDSIAGTIVAALAIGVIEALASGYLDEPLGSGFGGIAPYLLLFVMLTLRPYGLFGQPRIERV
jgi:branched-chain amino acid transport system permease protein